jgi:hypothetical protein
MPRSNSLLQVRPITLRGRLSHLSSSFSQLSSASMRLQPMTRLFEIFDESLIDCVNGICRSSECTFNLMKALATHFSIESIEPDSSLSKVQLADLCVTKSWLQTKTWQACVTHSILEPASTFPQLRIEFPLEIVSKVTEMIKTFPLSALMGNGQCIVRSFSSRYRSQAERVRAQSSMRSPRWRRRSSRCQHNHHDRRT